MCDETSLVAPDDYVASDVHGDGYDSVQYRLDVRNAARHRWFYFPHMRKDEVLLFKQWDSDPACTARVSFHTSFSDPHAPPDAPPRQSIEVRALAYFPDHEPNTCPRIPNTVPDRPLTGVDHADIGILAAKVLMIAGMVDSWPEHAKTWVASQLALPDGVGVAVIASALVMDQDGKIGLRDKPPSFQAAVKAKLLSTPEFEERLRHGNASPVRKVGYVLKFLGASVAGGVAKAFGGRGGGAE